MLRNIGSKYKDRRIITNTYKDGMAAIKVDVFDKDSIIKKEVRLRCSLSPLILNLVIKYDHHIKEKCRIGKTIKGETILI